MTTPINTLEAAVSDLLGTLSNASLALDPLTKARLVDLEDLSLRLELTLPGSVASQSVTLRVQGGRLVFDPACSEAPNAIVRGSLPGLISWLSGRASARNDSQTKATETRSALTFDGDEAVLEKFTDILRNFQPEFAEPLAKIFGEPMAENLLGAAQTVLAGLKTAAEGFGNAAKETTSRHYVVTPEMPSLLDSLDTLNLRVDRLAERVRRVEDTARVVDIQPPDQGSA